MDDWTLKDLTEALGFDDENQTQQYFKFNGVVIHEREDGTEFIDIGSVMDDIGQSSQSTYPNHMQTSSR